MPWVTSGRQTVVMVRPFKLYSSKIDNELSNEINSLKNFRKSEHVLNFVDCFMSIDSEKNQYNPNLPIDASLGVPTVYLIYERHVGNFAKSTNPKSPYAILKSMSLENRLRVYKNIAQTIDALHNKQFVYGNLEEETIVTMNDKLSQIKIFDFEFLTADKTAIPIKKDKYLISTLDSDVKAFGYLLASLEDISIKVLPDSTIELSKMDVGLGKKNEKILGNRPGIKKESPNQELLNLVQQCLTDTIGTFTMSSVIRELNFLLGNIQPANPISFGFSYNYNKKKVYQRSANKIEKLTDLIANPNYKETEVSKNFRGYLRKIPKYYNLQVMGQSEVAARRFKIKKTDLEETKMDPNLEARLNAQLDEEFKNVPLAQFFPDDNVMPKKIGRVVLGGKEEEETTVTETRYGLYIGLSGALLAILIAVPIFFVCRKRQ